MKQCNKCNENKKVTAYPKKSDICKECKATYTIEYGRSFNGRITNMFAMQKRSCIDRGHDQPMYTKQELTTWLNQNNYLYFIEQWKASGFNKNLCPSVDRLDDSRTYALNNIELVTWEENNKRAYARRKSCTTLTNQCRAVEQYSDGVLINTFASVAHAARETKTCRTMIPDVCNGLKTLANGYGWKYNS